MAEPAPIISSSSVIPLIKGNKRENAAKPVSAVPIIDLLRGPPDLDIPSVSAWVKAEHNAFEGKTLWNAEAELHVTEVAVSIQYLLWDQSVC